MRLHLAQRRCGKFNGNDVHFLGSELRKQKERPKPTPRCVEISFSDSLLQLLRVSVASQSLPLVDF